MTQSNTAFLHPPNWSKVARMRTRSPPTTNCTACELRASPSSCPLSSFPCSSRHSAVVRFAWHTLLNNGSAALEQPFPGQAHFSEGYTIGSHMGHCVEIIRHALTCYADATLEPLFQEDGIHPSKEIASGWGVHHTCRNLDSLTSWADSKSIHIYAKGDLNG